MRLQYFLEFKKFDLSPIKSFHLKDELNPKVWNDFEIDRKIREDLLTIGQDFFNSTDIKAQVIDIALCGSLCNYNWSENYSDYDLHIIINFDEVNENTQLVSNLCDLSKKIWNSKHDIKIKGYDVEVAIQNKSDLKSAINNGRMGGVYSLMKDKWVKKPEKVDFVPDEGLIEEKGKTFMLEIDDIIESSEKENYEKIKDRIKKVWEKIKRLRERSLEEEGEYGIGNLVFKLLRRNNYLGIIMNLKRDAYDKQFEEYSDDLLLKFFYDIEKIDYELAIRSSESWSSYINYEFDEDNNIIIIDIGSSGYSEGFSETWKIDFSDAEHLKVTKDIDENGMEPLNSDSNIEYYNSFSEIIKEIKENFGL